VVIITALTALAIPSILKQMRDRRTRQAAEEIAAVYRQARLRALGRGSAILVRYASATASYTTLEAMLGGATPNCVRLPTASCTNPNWNTPDIPGATSQTLSTWTPTGGVNSVAFANLAMGGSGDVTGASLGNLDICFTPMGRTLVRDPTAGPGFQQMSGVPAIRVSGADPTRLKRFVLIPPNGLARTDVAQ
jgi:Tfp pilus assembly protein FimT